MCSYDKIPSERKSRCFAQRMADTDGLPCKGVIVIVTWEGLLCVIAAASLIVEIIALIMGKKQ